MSNLFDVLDKVNELPGGKLHAYFMNNIQHINAGSNGWGNIKIAITTADAQAIMNGIIGNKITHSVMLFVVERDAMDKISEAQNESS